MTLNQIIDPQNATLVATHGGTNTATVIDFDGNTYTGRVWLAYADLAAAWGSFLDVYITRPTHIVYASSSPADGSDPVILGLLNAAGTNGVSFIAAVGSFTPTAITAVTFKNRGAGTNSALMATGPTVAGQFIQNTTSAAKGAGWALRSAGPPSFILTQPFAPTNIFGGSAQPAEDDTWGEGDVVNLYDPIFIDFRYLKNTNVSGDVMSGRLNVYGCACLNSLPGPLGQSQFTIDVSAGACNFVQVRCDSFLSIAGTDTTPGNNKQASFYATNCFFAGNVRTDAASSFIGGAIDASAGIGGCVMHCGLLFGELDGDIILSGGSVNLGSSGIGWLLGFVCLDLDANGAPLPLLQTEVGSAVCKVDNYGGNVLYASTNAGTSNINVQGTSRLVNFSGQTYAQTFTFPRAITGGMQINGAPTGFSTNGGSPAVLWGSIATTVAHLDAGPAGPTAFSGTAFKLGGGTITDVLL